MLMDSLMRVQTLWRKVVQNSADTIFDVFVIGGGINGVGVARDAVGRGFSVCLCEANDFASGTSSASSKLIHGGLRYLEYYKFRLVREALKEREVLLNMAPHIISPMRFVLPHSKGMRPQWFLRLGLFVYDHLGHRKILPGTRKVNLSTDVSGGALKPSFQSGFEYSDCWVDDARLVVLNAMDAANKGADMNVRTRVESAVREEGIWHIGAKNSLTGEVVERKARVLVNAAGPWVDEVLSTALSVKKPKNVRLVRGSHIVVNKVFEHDKSYIFQNADGRIIFAIPYEKNYTLIGTTDKDHGEKVGSVKIDPQELQYLCDSASEYFDKPIVESDVVWSYSGVRPLYDDGASEAQEATRDYVVETETEEKSPLINIFGGKITTYRRLSETILQHVEAFLGQRGPAWTARSQLPGGNFAVGKLPDLIKQLQTRYPFLEKREAQRFARSYGTLSKQLLGEAKSLADLGKHFGAGLYQAEIEYLVANEWATTAQDILFRRTKLGVGLPQDVANEIDSFLERRGSRDQV